jgi:hypothetical protein
VPKSVSGVLKWVSGYPGKHSRRSEITLQAIGSGIGRLERNHFGAVQFGVCRWLATYIPCREPAASARRLIARSHIRRMNALPG